MIQIFLSDKLDDIATKVDGILRVVNTLSEKANHDALNALSFQDQVVKLLEKMNQRISKMATTLEELEAEVAEATTVQQSAVVLIQGISQQLKDLIATGADPAKLKALSDRLSASTDALAKAITANTPAEPEIEL